MKGKTLILTAIILTATAITASIYLHWRNETKDIDQNTIRFIEPLDCSDNEATPDVGKFSCYYQDEDPVEGWQTLSIELSNAYPGYSVHCDFRLKNIGNETDTIENITVDPSSNLEWKWTKRYTEGTLWKDTNRNNAYDLSENVINITITDLVDLELISKETTAAQIDVQIAENAQQHQAYSFQITIIYEEEE